MLRRRRQALGLPALLLLLVLLGLALRSRLPTIVPDLAIPHAKGVQLEGARGPLSVGTIGTPHASFQRLTDSGLRILEFNPMNPVVARKEWQLNQRDHRKLLIVDGRVAFLGGINISSVYSGGSANLDWRSFPHKHELNAVVLSIGFGHQVQAMFDKDLAASDAVTLEPWQRRPVSLRMEELLGSVWEYWL